MSTNNDSAKARHERMAKPSEAANLIWLASLVLAALGGSLVISCITPFVAFALALAATVRLRLALGAMTIIWLTNQLIGFVFYNFPRTANTVLWGLAIYGAALLSTMIASSAFSHTRGLSIFVRLALALLIGFAAYEVTLFAAALFLGGRETFSLVIVTQLGFMNLAWLIGIGVLNELMSILCKSWVGVMPRLARAS
jgi:hypothetical protein